MTERVAHIRLPKGRQAVALSLARGQDTTVVKFFEQLIVDYAAGTAIKKPRAVPRDERTMTAVPIDSKVLERAKKRSALEGRSLSAVLEEAVAAAEAAS